MNYNQELTAQSAETLRMRMQDLAGSMNRVADSLQRGETVELSYIADEIRNVQELMTNLSSKLREHPMLASSERNATDMNEILDSCRSIQQRQDAIEKLKRLQLVKSFDEADKDAFDQLSQKIDQVIDRLTNGDADERQRSVELTSNTDSAYRALFEMINRPEELSDDRWMENQRLISETFGRNVTLAVLRGRAR